MTTAADVILTNKDNNGQLVASDVEGILLTTLIKNTMMPFQKDQKDKDKIDGLLIIKMDVEGAKFQVIKDIAKSNVLCNYIGLDQQNMVVMIVECTIKPSGMQKSLISRWMVSKMPRQN